jgi:hypothetical protein
MKTPFLFIAMLYDLPPFHSWKQRITLKYLPENEPLETPRHLPGASSREISAREGNLRLADGLQEHKRGV